MTTTTARGVRLQARLNKFELIESKSAVEQVQVRREPGVKSFASSASTSRAVSHSIGPIDPGVSTFPTVLTPTGPRRPAGGRWYADRVYAVCDLGQDRPPHDVTGRRT